MLLYHNNELTLLTDPSQPTRIGNSVTRNTPPDLRFVKYAEKATWANKGQNLGTDHYLFDITVPATGYGRKKVLVQRTKWNFFRYKRNWLAVEKIENIDEWLQELLKDSKEATTEVPVEEDDPKPDLRLVNLWEKQQTLQADWLKNKLKRNLKLQLVEVKKTNTDILGCTKFNAIDANL